MRPTGASLPVLLPVLLLVALTACAFPPAYQPGSFTAAAAPDWRTSIPADLHVDGHLPEGVGDFTRSRNGVTGRFCDRPVFPVTGLVDRRSASVSGPEFTEARDLRLFPDDRAAHRFLRRVHAVVAHCAVEADDPRPWRIVVRPSSLVADESFTVVRSWYVSHGLPVLGGDFWEVARVGNAVLLTGTGGEYEPSTTLGPGIRRHAAEVAGIVEAMCVFAAEPCP